MDCLRATIFSKGGDDWQPFAVMVMLWDGVCEFEPSHTRACPICQVEERLLPKANSFYLIDKPMRFP